jgi:hypothetical protein
VPTPDPHQEIEAALRRLMPVPLSDGTQAELDGMIDELAGETGFVRFDFTKAAKWAGLGGIAATVALVLTYSKDSLDPPALADEITDLPLVSYIADSDRVEGITDDGLYVDAGGSALRKVRIRVVEESQVRDEETGIIVVLSEPREEMFLVPVSTF